MWTYIYNIYLFIFGSTGAGTQGFTLARQALYHLREIPSPHLLYLFLPELDLDHNFPTYACYITGITGASHHAIFLRWVWITFSSSPSLPSE
jgi:hypothetical protein